MRGRLKRRAVWASLVWLSVLGAAGADEIRILDLPDSGTEPTRIDHSQLPVLAGTHAVVSPTDPVLRFQLHSYLVHHDGRFWCQWSQGPPVEDEPTQQVRFATSMDGLRWSEPQPLTSPPKEGYGFIARGFWMRDGELLALAAHFKGKGAFGVDKNLELRAFGWDSKDQKWTPRGTVFKDAINNFPPERVPGGDWLVTRRDSRFNVFALIGGRTSVADWDSFPIVGRAQLERFRPDEPIWWPRPDGTLVALFRDNGGSQRLFRAVSADRGRSWSTPVITNFPNATSKVFSLQTTRGRRLLISNANPAIGRRELHLSVSTDGDVFTRMARLAIPSDKPSTLQYPHAIEFDGQLFIVFSRNKGAIELLKVPASQIDALPR